MQKDILESKHFTLEQLADGVYACVHKPGGVAYSNAGIIDLGDRTLLVDALNFVAAGRDLRQTAESLFSRPVDMILLTHPHSDHWKGASAFDASTTLLSSKTTRQVCLEWGAEIMESYQVPAEWKEWLQEMQEQVQAEQDERVRAGLETSIIHTQYTLAEMSDFQPRYPDQTFEGAVGFHGSKRTAELLSFGRGHSEDDAVLLLEQDGIAFIGDIGFFDTQPFLGFCDLTRYREQMIHFQTSDFEVLVPGHGPVAYNKDYINLQLQYLNVMEALIGKLAQSGEPFEKALQITLPEPFDKWLVGGMNRFEVNVRYLFKHFGGEVPEAE